MPQNRDRRSPPGKASPAKDSVEKRAERDVDAMKKVLQRARAEVARSNTLADKIERRTRLDPDPDKNRKK